MNFLRKHHTPELTYPPTNIDIMNYTTGPPPGYRQAHSYPEIAAPKPPEGTHEHGFFCKVGVIAAIVSATMNFMLLLEYTPPGNPGSREYKHAFYMKVIIAVLSVACFFTWGILLLITRWLEMFVEKAKEQNDLEGQRRRYRQILPSRGSGRPN